MGSSMILSMQSTLPTSRPACADLLLRWCLEQQSPSIFRQTQNSLILKKNDWRALSISAKYIVHDHIVSLPSNSTYTISIRDDQHIGSNLNDIEWLCLLISSNAALRSLSLSNCRYL